MSIGALDMLKRLGSGVHPGGVSAPPGTASIESGGFAGLLAQVRAGGISSGRRVELPEGCGVQLTGEQIDRLSIAADAAEASGAWRMLALIDGKSVTVDVAQRLVVGGSDTAVSGVVTGIDAVVHVPSGSLEDLRALFARGLPGRKEQSGLAAGPGLGVRNESMAELLSTLDDSGRDGGDRAAA